MKKKPLCSVFGQCGGCLYQDVPYEEELQKKKDLLSALFAREIPELEDFISPVIKSSQEYYYRNRLDLKLVKTKDNRILIGFTPKEGRGILEIDECPIARKEISDKIPEIKKQVQEKLPEKYRRANLTVRTGDSGKVFWGGIGKRSNRLDESDYFWTEISDKKIYYSLETFFQANLSILPKLFGILQSLNCWGKEVCFYDLYGGVGLFGIGLSHLVGKVVLIENCLPATKIAKFNVEQNHLDNFEIFEGDVEQHLNQLTQKHAGPKVAMIDPPREGLSDQACHFFASFDQFSTLIYLSCNPEALVRDLKVFLTSGWIVNQIIPFDFFPKTRHLETLVILKR
jgi:tRNA/tmRNA/rRNA uracil-C5-methylase (TrmA/RlmC/RlmD family)